MASLIPAAASDAPTETTDSGIPAIGAVDWGTHFCQFYGTVDDHVQTVAQFFSPGLEANELCLWITSGESAAEALGKALPAAGAALARGAIEVLNSQTWYLHKKQFEPERVVAAWEQKLQWALENGYTGMRVVANEEWLTPEHWSPFSHYECNLNDALSGKKLVILCCYPLSGRSGEEVFQIASTHQFAIARRRGRWQVMETAEEVGASAKIERLNLKLEKRVRQKTRQLAAANDALVENAELFEFLAENTADVISLYNLAGDRVYVSPSYRKVIGWLPDEPLGGVRPQDCDSIKEEWSRLLAGEPHTTTYRHRHADGSWRWFETTSTPVQFRGSGHVLSVTRDVTQRMELEEQLHHSQKMEALGRLAGGVAHDFNNVLTAIFVYVGLLAREFSGEENVQAWAKEIKGAAERARQLTRQLLTFARRDVHQPRIVDAGEVTRHLEKMLRLMVREDVEISIETGSERLPVYIDPLRLEQVLLNVVANARDATPTGGTIKLSGSAIRAEPGEHGIPSFVKPGQYVRLAVSDTGGGVAPGIAERVFEPFFTTKPAGEGTGLGLSIVFGIVKQSEGYVWLDTNGTQAGTTVVTLLPYSRASPEPDKEEERAAPARNIAGLHVIVLEDDEAVRRLVTAVLERNGARVLAFARPEEALTALSDPAQTTDLLLTDVVLPAFSGPTIARLARSARPELKVLFMSGYNPEETLPSDSAEPLLEKPFGEDELLEKVSAVVSALP